ncbi:vacuolar membrane pq loop repeat protein [Purpureocillium lavendulum]|uniref:Vacuolar membrane pq loop repeat protein n=1 Tax=Purpureocillium lavendulum TaxID=1247861 RepID=A0AB34FX92_9HYPO|nr:vacuolar membrane pq loop repeat protein [Purpureocillium lavendulum]
MASLVATAAFTAAARTLPIGEALSGIFGSISLTAWICLLVRLATIVGRWFHWWPSGVIGAFAC